VSVSHSFSRAKRDVSDGWPVPDESVYPAERANGLGQLRVHPSDITQQQLAPFVPNLVGKKIENPEIAKKLAALAASIASMATTHAVSTALMETDPWDVMMIYHDAIDHVGHSFMEFHPPKMEHVSPEMFEAFNEVMNGIYRFHDMMLGRLLQFCTEDTTVLLCSDHGFLNDEKRPINTPGHMTGPAAWHRFHGVLAAKGPSIKRGESVHGASLLDMTPTLLHLLDLPVGRDMDGRVLLNMLDDDPTPDTVRFIESWDDEEGDFGEHSEDLRVDPLEAAEAIKQLVELGYVESADEDIEKQIDLAKRELKFNRATALLDAKMMKPAFELLKELVEAHPDQHRYVSSAAHVAAEVGQIELAKTYVKQLRALNQKANAEDPSAPAPQTLMLLGKIALLEGDFATAAQHLQAARAKAGRNVSLLLALAQVHMRQRHFGSARDVFERILEIDENEALAHFGLARVALKERRYAQAVDLALTAIEHRPFLGPAHMTLAQGLARCGERLQAITALKNCLKLQPRNLTAHRLLVAMYNLEGAEPLAAKHQKVIRNVLEDMAAHKADSLAELQTQSTPVGA
ncbi:MAG: tetratricopeptide repeat protein, partial [Planctomycetota bacterium]